MDAGAWWAAVHEVAISRTWLSDFTFTFHFHALEKEMATHSSFLAWRIPGTGEPGGPPSMGSHRAGHDWSDLAAAAADSMLMIITNLAWKPVSQDLCPRLHSNSISRPERDAWNPFSLANLVLKLSQEVCLGKGSGGTLTTLRHSFYLPSAASWGARKALLKLARRVLSCPLLMSMSEDFSVTFTF